MGFYLIVPAFVCYRRRPWAAAGFLSFGLVYGGVIGLARVVAGGHFPSDVLWAGGIVYFTALALAAPFRFCRARAKCAPPKRHCVKVSELQLHPILAQDGVGENGPGGV